MIEQICYIKDLLARLRVGVNGGLRLDGRVPVRRTVLSKVLWGSKPSCVLPNILIDRLSEYPTLTKYLGKYVTVNLLSRDMVTLPISHLEACASLGPSGLGLGSLLVIWCIDWRTIYPFWAETPIAQFSILPQDTTSIVFRNLMLRMVDFNRKGS